MIFGCFSNDWPAKTEQLAGVDPVGAPNLRDGWVGWWWGLFQVGLGSPQVGCFTIGEHREDLGAILHPMRIQLTLTMKEAAWHNVEGMWFCWRDVVWGMQCCNANMAVVPILIWFWLLNTKFLLAFCGRLGFGDGCLGSVELWMLRLNLTIARRPGGAVNVDGHFGRRSFQPPYQIQKKQKTCWLLIYEYFQEHPNFTNLSNLDSEFLNDPQTSWPNVWGTRISMVSGFW